MKQEIICLDCEEKSRDLFRLNPRLRRKFFEFLIDIINYIDN